MNINSNRLIFMLILLITSVLCAKNSYEGSTTLFSPKGELLQIENAELAGENGLPVCVSNSNDGNIVIISKSNVDSKVLIDRRVTDKINKIDKSIYVTFSGLLGDGLDIIRSLRKYCINYNVQYGCPPSVSNVARLIGDYQHKATLTSGERPYGIHTIVFGYDCDSKTPKIFKIKASGEVTRWRVVTIGKNYKKIMEKLEHEYNENLSTEKLISIILDKMLQFDKPPIETINKIQAEKSEKLGNDGADGDSKNNCDVYILSNAAIKIYPNIRRIQDIKDNVYL